MPAVTPLRCSNLCSASTGQGADILSIIFLLPWNSLVSVLFALACAAVSVCARGGEVVTGRGDPTRLSEAQPPHGEQQKQGESVSSQMDEKSRFPTAHQASSAKQPLPPTTARPVRWQDPPSWDYLFTLRGLPSLC